MKKVISLAIVLILILSFASTAALAAPSPWAEIEVNKAIDLGIVPTQLQTVYQENITRAEFCSLAVALYENKMDTVITDMLTFNDTNDENVRKMAGLGVVNGVGEGNFAPLSPLTREQAATILARLSAAMGNTLSITTPTFSDKDLISTWALDAVGQVQIASIMNGVGENKFDPAGPYTREQSILTMLRLYNSLDTQEEVIPLTNLTSTINTLDLELGATETLPYEIVPANATPKTVQWHSSDTTVASVDFEGNVTAHTLGETTITLTVDQLSIFYYVTVIDSSAPTISLDLHYNYGSPNALPLYADEARTELTGSIIISEFYARNIVHSHDDMYKLSYEYTAGANFADAVFYVLFLNSAGELNEDFGFELPIGDPAEGSRTGDYLFTADQIERMHYVVLATASGDNTLS